MVSFLQISPLNPCMLISSSPNLPHVLGISFFLIWLTFGEEYWSWRSSLCSLLHFPGTSSFLDPNIFPSTLVSKPLNLCSFINVRDQDLHPYQTAGKIVILYIFRLSAGRQKILNRDGQWIQSALIFFRPLIFDTLNYIPFDIILAEATYSHRYVVVFFLLKLKWSHSACLARTFEVKTHCLSLLLPYDYCVIH